MKPLTYFRACLLVPYAAAGLIQLSRPLLPASSSEPWLTVSLYALLAVVVGGLPYGVFAVLLWVWMRGKSTNAVRLAFAVAPLCLMAVVLAFDSLRFAWREALLVSYAYVAIFLLTEQVFRALGLIRDSTTANLRTQPS